MRAPSNSVLPPEVVFMTVPASSVLRPNSQRAAKVRDLGAAQFIVELACPDLLPLLDSKAGESYILEEESASAGVGRVVIDVRVFENDGAAAAMIDFDSVTELLDDERLCGVAGYNESNAAAICSSTKVHYRRKTYDAVDGVGYGDVGFIGGEVLSEGKVNGMFAAVQQRLQT